MIPKNRVVKDIRVVCKDALRQDWPVGSRRHVLGSYPERPGVLGAPQVAAALSVLIFETFHRQPRLGNYLQIIFQLRESRFDPHMLYGSNGRDDHG